MLQVLAFCYICRYLEHSEKCKKCRSLFQNLEKMFICAPRLWKDMFYCFLYIFWSVKLKIFYKLRMHNEFLHFLHFISFAVKIFNSVWFDNHVKAVSCIRDSLIRDNFGGGGWGVFIISHQISFIIVTLSKGLCDFRSKYFNHKTR